MRLAFSYLSFIIKSDKHEVIRVNMNESLFEDIKPGQLIGGLLSGLFFLVLTVQVLFPDLAIPFVGILVYALTMVDFISHEMGHFVFGLLGEFIGVLGGTMGQLFLPIICLMLTLRRRQWGFVSIFTFWMGQSLIQISAYVRDARSQSLKLFSPGLLLGGGSPIHDWHYLLDKTHLLWADQFLGWSIFMLGVALMLSAAGLMFARGVGLLNRKVY
ncbi:hypothetical protein hrd7_28510 [Leptolinea sp. HRD-7]|nr:hypothetical protein hrd7_28510 [Leptolinea sp. HRD-7]